MQVVSCDKKERVESDEVQVEIAANGRIPAHLITENIIDVTGPIEPLIGWERNNKEGKPNWSLSSEATICYAPGAVVSTEKIFHISEHGLLTAS